MGAASRANYITRTNSSETYAEEIIRFPQGRLGDGVGHEIILESRGRSLNCQRRQFLVSEVVLVRASRVNSVERLGVHRRGQCSPLGSDRKHGGSIKLPHLDREEGRMKKCHSPGPTVTSADSCTRTTSNGLPLLACATECTGSHTVPTPSTSRGGNSMASAAEGLLLSAHRST